MTFLLSDVEGSTRLWEGDEAGMGDAIARHYALLDAAIALHGGVRPAEQGEGDSVVGAFARPSDAVAAALAAQRAFAEEPWPQGGVLRIRVALHTGEAQVRDGAYYVGRAVIRCARLRSLAHGGQTLLSAATRDLIGDRLPDGAVLRDLGLRRLKDLEVPERVWQLCHPDLPAEFPPVRSLDTVARNMPAQLTSFVGRGAELADLDRALASYRLVTLTGSGGTGKTRLAVRAVTNAAGRHMDGAWWIELGPLSDPDLLPYAVARGIGLPVREDRAVLEAVCERLADADAVLALDNCEHLVAAAAALADRVLGSAPGLKVVATSREPLGISGELVWQVPPLADAAAARLFVERAGNVRPGFTPGAADAAAIAGICRRLDGIPLAIELAAARVRMMPPEQIEAALGDRFRLLTGGGRTCLARQQTLEASVAWSHDLLDGPERTLLRRLSVFAGGFTLEAAEAVCSDDPLDEPAVLELVSRLVDKSLVDVEHAAGGWYRLLETIRLFAGHRLLEAGEADATRDRHLDFFLDLGERAAAEAVLPRAGGLDQAAAIGCLAANLDNLRAAYVWSLSGGRTDSALRIATSMFPLWRSRGRRVEGSAWLDEALAAPGGCAAEHRLRALIARNRIEPRPSPSAADRVDEAVRLARELGDGGLLARALVGGLGYLARGPHAAGPMLREAMTIAEAVGDPEVLLDAREWLTLSACIAGQPVETDRLAREAVELATSLGNHHLERGLTAWQALSLLMRGDGRSALQLLQDVVARARRESERTVMLYTLGWTAWALALAGEHGAAAEACEGGAALAGAGDGVVDALECLGCGMAALARGEPDEAAAALSRGWQLVDGAPGVGDLLAGPRAEATYALGDLDAARRLAEEAVARSLDPPLPWQGGWALLALARVTLVDGRPDRAEDLAFRSLTLRVAIDDHGGIADTLEFLAGLAAGRGNAAEAVRLLGAADAARTGVGCRRFEIYRHVEQLEAHLEGDLGGQAYASAWAQGAALTPQEAAAYAVRGRGRRRRPPTGWAALTPTERQVVGLVADGLRNKEIADRLFISTRTVQTHMTHAFRKLGVTSRTQLAREVNRSREEPAPGGGPTRARR